MELYDILSEVKTEHLITGSHILLPMTSCLQTQRSQCVYFYNGSLYHQPEDKQLLCSGEYEVCEGCWRANSKAPRVKLGLNWFLHDWEWVRGPDSLTHWHTQTQLKPHTHTHKLNTWTVHFYVLLPSDTYSNQSKGQEKLNRDCSGVQRESQSKLAPNHVQTTLNQFNLRLTCFQSSLLFFIM